MIESQLSPLNLYYHSNKQEWRSRYVELESKKAKHFSCSRYGYNRAYFMATLYLRVVKDRHNVMSNDDLTFWYLVIKDFKSLEDSPQKVLLKPPTRTSNLSMSVAAMNKTYPGLRDKCTFLEERNQALFENTVSDIAARVYLPTPNYPVPDLCASSMRNEAANLSTLLKRYKAELEKSERAAGVPGSFTPAASPYREESHLSIFEIFQNLMKKELPPLKPRDMAKAQPKPAEKPSNKAKGKKEAKESKDAKDNKNAKDGKDGKDGKETKAPKVEEEKPETKRPRDEDLDDISAAIRMNKRTYAEASKMLNRFILKSADTLGSYDFLNSTAWYWGNMEASTPGHSAHEAPLKQKLVHQGDNELENFLKICRKNEDIIAKMSEGFGEEVYYHPDDGPFVSTFRKMLEDDLKLGQLEGDGGAKLDSGSSGEGADGESPHPEGVEDEEIEFNRSNSLYNQYKSSTSFVKATKDPTAEDDKADRNPELGKICNEKLSGLISQTEHLEEDRELRAVVYECLEQESRSSSDLESLIRISSRVRARTQTLYKSNRLYHLNGVYTDPYIDVVYKNGKIIPQSALQFYTKSNQKIHLSGSDKLDVHFDALEKAFKNFNQGDTVVAILDSLEAIDAKLHQVVREYEKMHRALHRYVNAPEKDPESTNEVEELLNLETLHLVAETLLDTKLRFIQQVRTYFDSQLKLLETVIPPRYYRIFTQILYHPYNEF